MTLVEIRVMGYRCERCQHEWVPRGSSAQPRVCPKCKSPYWDRKRMQEREPVLDVAASHAELLAALRRTEWGNNNGFGAYGFGACCPVCASEQEDGHATDCEIGAAIARAEALTDVVD